MNHVNCFDSSRKCRRGFTLTEVVIAMAVLSMALIALISVTAAVVKGNSFNKKMTTAATLAKDQMEALKNKPYAKIESSGDYPSWLSVENFPGYERRWQVATISGNTSCTGTVTPYTCCTGSDMGTCPDRKSIDMDVRWHWRGAFHQVTLSTIIAP